jgi:CDP-diacylglycerol--glycerol-3-phosphate 3-phosphatidyltransferase
MVVIIIGREFAVSGLRSIASARVLRSTHPISAKSRWPLKLRQSLLILNAGRSGHPVFHSLGRIALYFVVLFALSLIGYFRTFWGRIDDRFKARERRRLILLQRQSRQVRTRDVATH